MGIAAANPVPLGELSAEQAALLAEYAATADRGGYMQRMAGVHELYDAGLLEWMGEQYGTSFYTITDAGRAALAARSEA